MMSNIVQVEFGLVCLAFWLLSLAVLWFTVDRKTRPGPIRSVAAIEGMMLVSIISLILGASLCIRGLGLLE